MRWILLCGLLLVHVTQSRQYAHVWASNLSLWEHAARVAPMKSRPHMNYSRYLIEVRRLDEAWEEAQLADWLLDQPHVSEHEKVSRRKGLYHNLMMLSYLRQVEERRKRKS